MNKNTHKHPQAAVKESANAHWIQMFFSNRVCKKITNKNCISYQLFFRKNITAYINFVLYIPYLVFKFFAVTIKPRNTDFVLSRNNLGKSAHWTILESVKFAPMNWHLYFLSRPQQSFLIQATYVLNFPQNFSPDDGEVCVAFVTLHCVSSWETWEIKHCHW